MPPWKQPCGCGIGWVGRDRAGRKVCACPACVWRCPVCKLRMKAQRKQTCEECERG